MASHCLREACLTGESLERSHAVRRRKKKEDCLETDGNAVVAADLDVRVVPLEWLREGPVELETILMRPKGGRSG